MENEILSWVYWGADKSEIIRNLGLIVIALVGLPFLILRSIASHTGAKAALATSMASLKNSEASLKQSVIASKQAEAALLQAKNTEKQTSLIIQNQFLEYMVKGFEQLSSENPIERIGAVYTLERLAEQSENDRYPIMKALQLHIKSSSELPYSEYLKLSGINTEKTLSKLKEEIDSEDIDEYLLEIIPESLRNWPDPPADIQAITEILGGKIRNSLIGKNKIILRGVNLRGADWVGLDFSDCIFTYSNLSGIKADNANFQQAILYSNIMVGASLRNTNMKGAFLGLSVFKGANLSEGDLSGANLKGTNFERTNLRKVNFTDADLTGADLTGADLTGCIGLEQSQLETTTGNSKTILPNGLVIKES